MSMHEGHRERLKKRFLAEGLDNFTDVQVLELLLFYAIPQRDTNPLAHELIAHFGSLSQVFRASAEELEKIPGIKRNASTLIKLVPDVMRFIGVDEIMNTRILPTIESCGEYLKRFLSHRENETVFLLCLDSKCKVLCCKEIGEGNVNSAAISIRRIVETALGVNASSVVLAHNHPSGIALPSAEDVQTSIRAARALAMVDIAFADHIIVADDDYVSLVQSGHRFDDFSFD